MPIAARVITVSTRSFDGHRADVSGPLAVERLRGAGYAASAAVVPDGAGPVAAALRDALDAGARLVITSGGTGVTPTDRTPEGTREIVDRELPGFGEYLRSATGNPMAYLSRGVAGVVDGAPGRPGALVVNLPGKPAAVTEGLDALLPLVPHVLEQLEGGDH